MNFSINGVILGNVTVKQNYEDKSKMDKVVKIIGMYYGETIQTKVICNEVM